MKFVYFHCNFQPH